MRHQSYSEELTPIVGPTKLLSFSSISVFSRNPYLSFQSGPRIPRIQLPLEFDAYKSREATKTNMYHNPDHETNPWIPKLPQP